MGTAVEPELGTLMVRAGLVTPSQLEEALAVQRRLGAPRPIGQILVEQQVITQRQLNLILEQHHKRPRLGEVLVASRAISGEQLALALDHQKRTRLPLGETLVSLNYVTEEVMRQALCTQLNIPFVDLDQFTIDRKVTGLVNKSYAKTHGVVPVSQLGTTLTVAMDDPTDVSAVEELQWSSGFTVMVLTSTRAKIQKAFARAYEDEPATDLGTGGRLELIAEEEPAGKSKYVEGQQSRRADELVRRLVNVGIDNGASDIHLETLAGELHVRLRVDGVLQRLNLGTLAEALTKNLKGIISRIKILAKLDIAEKRRPQDGSFQVRVDRDGQSIALDFRVSVIPGYYGESVVLRILDRRRAPTSVQQLGFSKPITDRLGQLLQRTTGIILITGPTGSGKSTTLYGCLMTVYRPEIRILTAEDPIEYVYEAFSQSEVNTRIGNTFASYLRAFLRHDPEVIMVGEIRDEETAEMAFRAAQTGHLLFSTLHTNTAVTSLTRLLDLRADPNLIASSLLGVLSQRLVRKICTVCREEYLPSETILREFYGVPPAGVRWYRGRGCPTCNFTGYKGRMAVAELWVPSENDVILISKGAPFDEIRESAKSSTLSMADDVREKLIEGSTNLEELIRTLPYSAIYDFRSSPLCPATEA